MDITRIGKKSISSQQAMERGKKKKRDLSQKGALFTSHIKKRVGHPRKKKEKSSSTLQMEREEGKKLGVVEIATRDELIEEGGKEPRPR